VAEPIDALEAETIRVGSFLASVQPDDWQRPTRCPPMSFREIAVHALRGAYRIREFLAAPPSGNEPEKDAVTYYGYEPGEGAVIVQRAKQESEKRAPDADIAGEWRAAWADAIAAARTVADDDPVVVSPFGSLRLREYLKTRCVEVGIHAMDLRDALRLEPDPAPEALEVTCDVLRGILGADLRPLGVNELHFALAGTGRVQLTTDEREMLGPLSDSFPLLQ
jgi:uncharacterized protein (TIGR03083 family)